MRRNLQYPLHRDAEGVFVDAGPLAVAAEAEELGALGFGGAATGKPLTALHRDLGGGGEGLDVVDHGRPVQVAVGGRERWADARHAMLAFQRLDQRRFLAADVSAGAQMDVDVEVETGIAENGLAQQSRLAAALQVSRSAFSR